MIAVAKRKVGKGRVDSRMVGRAGGDIAAPPELGAGTKGTHARNAAYSEDVARNPDPKLHEGLIRKHSGRLAVSLGLSIEDARAEIMVQWWKYAQRYDPGRTRWSTYFHSHVLRQARDQILLHHGWMRTSVPSQTAKKGSSTRIARRPMVTMGMVVNRRPERGEWRERAGRDVRAGDELRMEREWLAGAMRDLEPRERVVIEMRMQGFTLREVAVVVKTTRERVRQVQNQVMEKLRGWAEL